MERDFGLTIVRNERDPEQLTRAPGRNEFEQARRLDTDLKAIRETIRECWDRSEMCIRDSSTNAGVPSASRKASSVCAPSAATNSSMAPSTRLSLIHI